MHLPPPLRLSLAGLLAAIVGAAVVCWLFRLGALAGLLGLAVAKHVAIAWLCEGLGVGRSRREARPPEIAPPIAVGAEGAGG